ncbi:MAG: DUF4442 domain-containing protein [Bacteroidota bacterium]
MSFYQQISRVGSKYIGKAKLFKYGFNLSPMYRRSTARITEVSADLRAVKIKLPISYKNRNYVNSIFGGSMFSAVDPIPMVQLINILDNNYIVWDKSATIHFKRPARENLYAEFHYSEEELEAVRKKVDELKEIEIVKTTQLTNQDQSQVFCEIQKTIYIADKAYFKQKRARKSS